MQSAWRCLGREEGPATPLLALPILLPSMERGNSARCHYCCYPTCYSERSLHHRSTTCFPPTLSMEGVSSVAATMLNQPSCRGREFYTVLPAHVIQPAILRQYASLQSASVEGESSAASWSINTCWTKKWRERPTPSTNVLPMYYYVYHLLLMVWNKSCHRCHYGVAFDLWMYTPLTLVV